MSHLQAVQLLLQLRHTDLLLLDPVQDLLLRPGHLFLKRQADTVESKSHNNNHFGPNDEFTFCIHLQGFIFIPECFFIILKSLFFIKTKQKNLKNCKNSLISNQIYKFTTNNKCNNKLNDEL